MKVCLYTENYKQLAKSGLGRAIRHQMKALSLNGIEYTTDLSDDYDVLHINTYNIRSFLMAHLKAKEAAIVYHAHSTEEDFRDSFKFSNQIAPAFKWWLKQCYNLGDVILTPTNYSKQLLEDYGLNPPIYVVSNGIDLSSFKMENLDKASFYATYQLNPNQPVIMGVGLYIKRKGILDFVELAKRLPHLQFIWFGYTDSFLITNDVSEALKTKIPNLQFPGYVDPLKLKEAYQNADLFLFPSYEETEGIVLLESFAMKLPVLIRDIPIYEEFTDHQVLHKATNLEEFEQRIHEILNSNIETMVNQAYEIVKKKDLILIGQQLIEVYQKALHQKSLRE